MKFLRFFLSISLVLGLAAGFGSPAAMAQDKLQSSSLIRALSAPKTRSLFHTDTMKGEDRAFVHGLRGKTRGIQFKERQKLATIVQKYDLRKVDLDIYFDYDSDKITAKARPDLVQLGIALRSGTLSKSVFLVSGFTDAKGSADYNLALSDRRARSVVNFLTGTFGIREVSPHRGRVWRGAVEVAEAAVRGREPAGHDRQYDKLRVDVGTDCHNLSLRFRLLSPWAHLQPHGDVPAP